MSIDKKIISKKPSYELASRDGSKAREILKRRILIGRSQACDIVINDPSVSDIHAVLEMGKDKGHIF